jgi:hypothetical protein
LIWFSQHEGVWEFDVPFVVHLLRWFFCFLGRGSFHFVPCITPFLGALVFYDWQGFIIFFERKSKRKKDDEKKNDETLPIVKNQSTKKRGKTRNKMEGSTSINLLKLNITYIFNLGFFGISYGMEFMFSIF